MNYFKKIIDWVLTAYEPEFKPKRVYKYKGKTYKLTGSFGPVNQIAGMMTF